VLPCYEVNQLHKKQGKEVTNTIDLLETIGQDALLRHASAEDLTKMLSRTQASEALTAAVATGDSSRLSEELGRTQNQSPEGVFSPAHEEEPEEGDPLEVPIPDKNASPSKQ
jgi:hypothetical protein